MSRRSLAARCVAVTVALACSVSVLAAPSGAESAERAGKRRADLTVGGRLAAPTDGERVRGVVKVRNRGTKKAASSKATLVAVLGGTKVRLTDARVPAVRAGKSRSVPVDAAVPLGLDTGRYQLRWCVDVGRDVREAKEGNNCRSVGSMTVTSRPRRPVRYTANTPVTLGPASTRYVAQVPTGYDDSHRTPTQLFVWLHGCGGASTADIGHFSARSTQSHITVMPTLRDFECWRVAGDRSLVLRVIKDARTHFNIDPRRVVLGGFSSGGNLAFRVAFDNSTRIAGVLGTNTAPFLGIGLTRTAALRGVRFRFRTVMVAHTDDTTYPIATVREEMQALRNARMPSVLIERPGEHYEDDEPLGNPTTGTYHDIKTLLLPYLEDGWRSPGR